MAYCGRGGLALGELAGVAGLFSAYSSEAAWFLMGLGCAKIARCFLKGSRKRLALVPAASVFGLLVIEFLRPGHFLERCLQGF